MSSDPNTYDKLTPAQLLKVKQQAAASGAGNGLTSPRQPGTASSDVNVLRKPVPAKSPEQVIRAWAATLTPSNAPAQRHMGPLAWVRGEKVEELLNLLRKEGF